MVASILRIKRRHGETVPDYCRRRNREAASLCRSLGAWSTFWFERAVSWDDHIARNHSPHCWPMLLRQFHDEAWLLERRLRTNFHGTGTRRSQGRPAARWHEAILWARERI